MADLLNDRSGPWAYATHAQLAAIPRAKLAAALRQLGQ